LLAAGAGSYSAAAAGFVVAPTLLMLLFRQKYPRWWFDWNVALAAFSYRCSAYFLLLRDEYPSTDEEQAVHLQIVYPNAMELNRWLPLVKWLLAIPHYIVLVVLGVAALVCVVIAWFAILFTGTYPRGLFVFVVGVLRWSLRVRAYAFLLVTDQYPPFQLSE
jgi:asparagine N-glycosylation enzyme membrane subunit Stt3